MLKLTNISHSYGEHRVLSNVTLSLCNQLIHFTFRCFLFLFSLYPSLLRLCILLVHLMTCNHCRLITINMSL